jgi:hypothetical protein
MWKNELRSVSINIENVGSYCRCKALREVRGERGEERGEGRGERGEGRGERGEGKLPRDILLSVSTKIDKQSPKITSNVSKAINRLKQ